MQLENHSKQIHELKQDWESKPEEQYWQGEQRPTLTREREKRDIMRSTGMQNESQSVLDKQMAVF